MAVEIASAYVSLSADTRQIPKDVRKALGQAEGAASSSGQSIGQKISSGLGKTLKAGALTGGAAAGAALGMSLKKGFDRLSAIEQSEAKLSGLGHSTESVAKIMDNALGSVKGTAYGLGDAASVAAGMVAAGIKPGKELEGVLKTMGDTAAIAGRDLTDVGLIFQSIAAKGKLQGDDMMQLMSSGIPVLQLLGDELGKTSTEVSDMVSNGEIDFKTFESAMRKGMGGASQEMGQTFSGSLANMQAAMGRFGEAILQPGFDAAPAAIGRITEGIDSLTEKTSAAIEIFKADDIAAGEGILSDSVANKVLAFRDAVDKARGAVELLVTGDFNGGIREKLGIEEDDPLVGQILDIRDVFIDWGERVGDVFSQIGSMAEKLAPSFGRIAGSLGKAVAKVSAATWEALLRILEALVPVLEKVLVPMFEKLADVMEDNPRLVESLVAAFVGLKVLNVISGPVKAFTGTIGALSKGFGTAKAVLSVGGKGSIVTALKGFGAAAGQAAPAGGILAKSLGGLGRVGGTLSKVFGAVVPWVGKFGKIFFGLITKINPVVAIISTVVGALTWFFTKTETGQAVFETLKSAMETAWNWIRDTFISGMEWARDVISGIWDGISTAANVAWEGMKLAWDTYGQPVLDFILGVFNFFWEGIKLGFRLLRATFEVAWTALKMAWDAFGQPIVNWIIGAFQRFWGGIKVVFDWIKIGWSALWQGLKLAWDTIGAPIVNFVKGAFSVLWTGLSTVFGWIKTGWNILWNGFKAVWDTFGKPIVDGIVNTFNWFKDGIGRAFDTVKGFAEGLWNSISEWFGKISDKVGGIKDNILDKFKGAKDWLVEAGGNIIDGLLNGIGDLGKKIGDWFLNKIPGWIKEPFKKALDIHSPSRVFRGFGQNIGQGLINGIDGMGRKVENAAQRMADNVASADMPTFTVDSQVNAPTVPAGASGQATNDAPAPATRGVPPAAASMQVAAGGIQASVQGEINPAMQQADLSVSGFGETVTATTTGVITPQIDGMATNIQAKSSSVINPAMAGVRNALTQTGAWFQNRVGTVVNPMWNAMGANVQRVQKLVTDPAMAGIRNALTATGNWFQSKIQSQINPMWNNMGQNVQRVWNAAVNPTFGALRNGLSQTSAHFGNMVNNINTAWSRLRAGTGRPARFVVESVFNNGIRNAWNAVADMIDGKSVKPIGLGSLGAYKTGGVLPGYTPGRDVHQFTSPSGGRIMLSGGEAIMRPEWTRAVGGARAVDAMNKAARTGQFPKARKHAGGEMGAFANGGVIGRFANGGIVESMRRVMAARFPMLQLTSGLRFTDNGYHSKGQAADFSNGGDSTPEMRAATKWIYDNYRRKTIQLIHHPSPYNIGGGAPAGNGMGYYKSGTMMEHQNHVHWAVNGPVSLEGTGPVPAGFVAMGGDGGGMDINAMVKEDWDKHIKKIPTYKGGNGSFAKAVPKLKEKMVDNAWKFVEKKLEKMSVGPGAPAGSGAERWRPMVRQAMKRQGEAKDEGKVSQLVRQIHNESRGVEGAVQNIVDINGTGESAGVGLLQFIPTTWASFRDPGLVNDRKNGWANINAGVRYARRKHNWGPIVGSPGGWKNGGVLPHVSKLYDNGGYLEDGQVGQNQSGKPEPVFTHKQWQILKGNIMSAAQAGDLKKLQVNLGVVANGLQQAVAKLDWQEIFGAASKAFNDKFFDDQAADVRSVFGIPDPDSIPAVKAYAEFRENEKKLNEEQSQAAKDSREAATRADSAADKISGAPVPVKAKSESVSVGSQVARTGALVSRALANPNPVSVGAAAKSGGDTIQFIVRNEEAAWSEYRKFQAKNSRGRVGAR